MYVPQALMLHIKLYILVCNILTHFSRPFWIWNRIQWVRWIIYFSHCFVFHIQKGLLSWVRMLHTSMYNQQRNRCRLPYLCVINCNVFYIYYFFYYCLFAYVMESTLSFHLVSIYFSMHVPQALMLHIQLYILVCNILTQLSRLFWIWNTKQWVR